MSSPETVIAPPPTDDQVAPPGVASRVDDLVTVIFGACLIGGATTDGWAHNNILSEVQQDGFFTPWHAMLYTGFAATAAWTFWLAFRRRHQTPRWWVDGWPIGYRLGAIGVVIFLVAGFLDMVWHEVFGIEVTIDALLSPSHLLLCIGSVLLLTSPTRSWWAAREGGLRAATGIVALALATTSISIFMLYASAFDYVGPLEPYDGTQFSVGYALASLGVASYVVTAAVIVVPLLLCHRRRTTFGVTTVLVTLVAIFPAVVYEFPRPETVGALAVIPAAVLADWIIVRLDGIRGFDAPLRLPIAGAIVPVVVFATHLAALQLSVGIEWPVELWTGTVVTVAAVGALLGGLAARPTEIIR